jgi:hypothetical protein
MGMGMITGIAMFLAAAKAMGMIIVMDIMIARLPGMQMLIINPTAIQPVRRENGRCYRRVS